MITAYLDETQQETKDHVIIAGHVGYEQSWLSFIPAWNQALGPQRKRLHMKELRFTKDSTRRLLARLGPVASECKLKRLIGGAKVSDYSDLLPNDPLQKLFSGDVVALMASVTSLLMFEIPDTERIQLVFEEQERYRGWAEFALSRICRLPEPRVLIKQGVPKLASWSFVPKESTMLVDQADYLCYAELQRLRDPESERAKWCSPILDAGKPEDTLGRIMDRDFMRDAVADIAKHYSLFQVRPPAIKTLGAS